MVFDTHTHAYFDQLAEREEELLRNMDERDVRFAVQIGCDVETSRKAVELAKRHPDRYRATVGLHPGEAQSMEFEAIGEEIRSIRELLENERDSIVAIGETGWDFYRLSEDPELAALEKERERIAFEAQIALAKEFGLPLVIHTRNSGEATLESIEKYAIEKAVIHCFSEDLAFARRAMELSEGIRFWFSGILTYKSAKNVHEAAREVPLDKILVETDAPFLSPEPVRGTVNESANVRYVLERLKTFRKESPEDVEAAVWSNAVAFYGLTPNL